MKKVRHSNLEDYWPRARGLSAESAIGTKVRDPIDSGPIRWRLTIYMDAVAESGGTRFSFSLNVPVEKKRADADGTVEPDSLARPNSQARARTGKLPCSADHEQGWQPYPVDPCSAESADYTYKNIP